MKNVNVNYSDDKYDCGACSKELTKIKEGAMRWIDTSTCIKNGGVESDPEIDWNADPQDAEYTCGECGGNLGEDMTVELAEDMLKHNAGEEINDNLIDEDDEGDDDDEDDGNEELLCMFENDGNGPDEGLTWSSKKSEPADCLVIDWPHCQKYMDEPWFLSECYLDMTEQFFGPAYWIPISRLEEYAEAKKDESLCTQ